MVKPETTPEAALAELDGSQAGLDVPEADWVELVEFRVEPVAFGAGLVDLDVSRADSDDPAGRSDDSPVERLGV